MRRCGGQGFSVIVIGCSFTIFCNYDDNRRFKSFHDKDYVFTKMDKIDGLIWQAISSSCSATNKLVKNERVNAFYNGIRHQKIGDSVENIDCSLFLKLDT